MSSRIVGSDSCRNNDIEEVGRSFLVIVLVTTVTYIPKIAISGM